MFKNVIFWHFPLLIIFNLLHLQGFDFGSQGFFTCLKPSRTAAVYDSAAAQCRSWGGYLASVKTQDKLELIISLLPQGTIFWVGFDNGEEDNVNRWQEDNEILTTDQISAVFAPGQPDNGFQPRSCGMYDSYVGKLVNQICQAKVFFLCEAAPLSVC